MSLWFARLNATILAIAVASSSLAAADKPADPATPGKAAATKDSIALRGLLITGGCCHDYDAQKQIITQGLGQRLNITFDVVHEGGTSTDHIVSVYQSPDWADKYDVVIHNECFADVKDEKIIQNILKPHMEGKPAIFIHCAMHSYRSAGAVTSTWRNLIGVTSQRHESHHPEPVKAIDIDHPVLKGFPKEWTTPNGELYVIEATGPNCIPLAEAYGKDSDKTFPVAWVNTLGKTKVFGTTLGHHNETMNSEEWLGLVSRGVLWTVDKLQDDGTPAAGFEGTGAGEIKITPPEVKPEADPKGKK